MATYAYKCRACGQDYEVNRPMSERQKMEKKPPKCPSCGSKKVQTVPSMFTAIRDWRRT
jgi:putative FmdB family regulatory protein